MKNTIITFQLLLLAIIITACQSEKKENLTDKAMLNGAWTLSAINDTSIDKSAFEKTPQLQFDISNNSLSGNDGCNTFSGDYEVSSTSELTFGTQAKTAMACLKAKGSQELNDAMSKVKSFKIEGSQLLLFDDNNTTVLSYNKDTNVADTHNSENALDWNGSYFGTIPCADCPGIETELTLNPDKTYRLNSVYLEKTDGNFTEYGTFSFNDGGNAITLNVDGESSKSHQYKVMENKLMKLDIEGNEITSELKDNYILSKKEVSALSLNEGEFVYWVNSKKVACTGVGEMTCMQIQKGETLKSNQWKLTYSSIMGFEFEEGYIYKLVVKETKLPANQVPADASSIKYELIRMLEKNIDSKLRLHDIWALDAVKGEKIDIKNYGKHPNLEINLTTNKVMGTDGCNNFNGDINNVDSSNLSFKPLASTRKACPNMEYSNAIGKYLGETETYKYENLSLSLYNKNGEELLSYKKVD